ncbi:MAG: hypothetical protein IKL23_05105, partial [Oscillospiraceae bacterium]|nr:hypothetical protein [Oscillospiraceae bacterium]
RLDDEEGRIHPGLNYTVAVIKAPFLYELCKERLISEKDESANSEIPEGFKRVYLNVDPQPWGAVEAYQLAYQDTGALQRYLICYEDRIVEISFDWEPTAEHKAIVGEKLGGK